MQSFSHNVDQPLGIPSSCIDPQVINTTIEYQNCLLWPRVTHIRGLTWSVGLGSPFQFAELKKSLAYQLSSCKTCTAYSTSLCFMPWLSDHSCPEIVPKQRWLTLALNLVVLSTKHPIKICNHVSLINLNNIRLPLSMRRPREEQQQQQLLLLSQVPKKESA